MLSNLSSSLIQSFLLVIGVSFVISPVTATDHIVGANKGWNPGINYTLWANNQTFYVGDYISFRYKKDEYNVYEVNKTGYDNCTTQGAAANWSKGKDFIHLNKPGKYYFICGTGGCSTGMKVSIVVETLPPPPPAASVTATTKHSSEPAQSAAVSLTSGWWWLLLVVGFQGFVFVGLVFQF